MPDRRDPESEVRDQLLRRWAGAAGQRGVGMAQACAPFPLNAADGLLPFGRRVPSALTEGDRSPREKPGTLVALCASTIVCRHRKSALLMKQTTSGTKSFPT